MALAWTTGIRAADTEDAPATRAPGDPPARIYADAFLTWIYARPERDVAPIGYLRAGQSTPLRSVAEVPAGKPVRKGCGRGWYAVEPFGFVCLDHTASLTPTRYSESMAVLAPDAGAYPFDFALSMGTPSYRRVPTASEWTRRERKFGEAKPRPLPPHWRGHEELVSDESIAPSGLPEFLSAGGSVSREAESRLLRREVPFGSMLAVDGAFESAGRRFLMSADGTVVPADRMRVFRRSTFRGVDLATTGKGSGATAKNKGALALPLAWPRKETKLYRVAQGAACALDGTSTATQSKVEEYGEQGTLSDKPAQLSQDCLVETTERAPPRKVLELTGRTVDIAGTRFAEIGANSVSARTKPKNVQDHTSSDALFIPTRYVYLAEQRRQKSVDENSREKWIHFSIGQGTLVTYEGQTPVFATLASPGIGGVPAPGADPLDTRTTPVGSYRIQFKHRSDDMSPEQTEDRSYWIADVPFAMYFKQPFAIHVAYWHESFGEPMSGGCINVSPLDGERLFQMTDPKVPDDWYGVGASREFGLGTRLVIER